MTRKTTCVIASQCVYLMVIYLIAANSQNSVNVLAGQPKQIKIEKAREWHIPIVNYLWLEDTFRAWTRMPLTDRKYTEYPPGLNWMQDPGLD